MSRPLRSDLPRGTVTFLFTDIEGSTRLLNEMGPEAYGAALLDHRRALREAFSTHGGVEVDTQGDAFLVAFADATQAVAGALDAQSAIGGGPIRVRIGVHMGRPMVTGDGYIGEDVHLGARVAAAGHGGQILVTRSAYEALDESSRDDFEDLGEHRVKDFERPVWIYQVGRERFPPLRTISNTNLPRPASSFVGREREVEEVAALLGAGARLVTLTGPGGTGKTRLAIEAASTLVPHLKSGVFWVPLASVRDHALVSETIARTLGAKNGLADHIGEREMLLLVDNLEQVITAAPELGRLVEQCPNLRLLVTSRELLRVHGEVEYAVDPLAKSDSVELFVQRSGLAADATVEELCTRLDNLPLAIELAAARARVLTPGQILDRLSGRLDLLKGTRDAHPRQQTLRTAIEWSYDLLTDEEKSLFARLAVFRGGCTLEAAESVADADLESLQGLVDKSLVRHIGNRFLMLETIREFASELLDASGDAHRLRRRHADFFLERSEVAEPHLLQPDRDAWMDDIDADHDNSRVALDYLEHGGDFQSAMRMAGSLAEFWDQRGHHPEAFRRYERLLGSDTQRTAARAKALDGASMIATKTAKMERAEAWAVEALELYREQANEHGVAVQLWGLGFLRLEAGDNVAARDMLSESVERLRALGDTSSAMWAMRGLAYAFLVTGDAPTALSTNAEAAAMARAAGDVALAAATTAAQAPIALDAGLREESISLTRQSLALVPQMRDPLIQRSVLCTAAGIIARLGGASPAATLLGYADAQADEVGTREPWVERMNEETIGLIRATNAYAELDEDWRSGRALDQDQAIAVALAALDEAGERHRS